MGDINNLTQSMHRDGCALSTTQTFHSSNVSVKPGVKRTHATWQCQCIIVEAVLSVIIVCLVAAMIPFSSDVLVENVLYKVFIVICLLLEHCAL